MLGHTRSLGISIRNNFPSSVVGLLQGYSQVFHVVFTPLLGWKCQIPFRLFWFLPSTMGSRFACTCFPPNPTSIVVLMTATVPKIPLNLDQTLDVVRLKFIQSFKYKIKNFYWEIFGRTLRSTTTFKVVLEQFWNIIFYHWIDNKNLILTIHCPGEPGRNISHGMFITGGFKVSFKFFVNPDFLKKLTRQRIIQ